MNITTGALTNVGQSYASKRYSELVWDGTTLFTHLYYTLYTVSLSGGAPTQRGADNALGMALRIGAFVD